MPYNLRFIEEEKFIAHVKTVVDSAKKSQEKSLEDMHTAVIDPFSALFDATLQKVDSPTWLEGERERQRQKTLQNTIGHFHQNVLGDMPHWENTGYGGGIDNISHKHKAVAEIKNKYSTVNSKGLVSVYDELQATIDGEQKGYVAYFVNIICKNPIGIDVPFAPCDKGIYRPEREDIRRIDGHRFYDLAAGESGALKKVYAATSDVLAALGYANNGDDQGFNDLFERAFGS